MDRGDGEVDVLRRCRAGPSLTNPNLESVSLLCGVFLLGHCWAFQGVLHSWNGILLPGIFLVMAYASVDPFSKQLNCYWMGVVGWALALLQSEPILFWLGSGFVASLCQVGRALDLPLPLQR